MASPCRQRGCCRQMTQNRTALAKTAIDDRRSAYHAMPAESRSCPLRPTPTRNRHLKQRVGGFSSVVEALDYAAKGEAGYNFYSGRGDLIRALPYVELRNQAEATARRLLSLGFKRGDRVALVAETSPEFLNLFFGCQYAGLIPVPLPLPT